MTQFPDIEGPLDSPIHVQARISVSNLPPLQTKSMVEDVDQLDPLLDDDPGSFDLVSSPISQTDRGFSLEARAEEMVSRKHLEEIFADRVSMLKFTTFLSTFRPSSVPVLLHYLDAVKSQKAISYANAIISQSLAPIKGQEFSTTTVDSTVNQSLEKRVRESFDALVKEDLPAYISHIFVQVVGLTLRHRVTGQMPLHLREASEGLAEVFCLTDPSRKDNPIIFASEEFHRTTQYGVDYAIGRNCRFLQGPNTSPDSVRRIKEAIANGIETTELFLN
jgi:hypothetical protein